MSKLVRSLPLCVLGLLVLAWLVTAPCARADEDVAEFLIGQAKKAIAKRDYDEAIEKLERARAEAPDLPEPAYLLGTVYDKRKDEAGALASYRAFREACLRLGDKLDSKSKRLLRKAERRIEKLAKGDAELEKATTSFVRSLLRLAEGWREKDPDLAADAARRVLAILPGHEDAEKLLASLESPVKDVATTKGPPSPVPGVTSWRDMLAARDIPADDDEKRYKDGVLVLDQEGGSIFWTDGPTRGTGTYVYDMEFRFLEDHKPGYLLGLVFAKDEEADRNGTLACVMAFAQRSALKLVQADGGKNVDVGESAVRSRDHGTWQRLTVAVKDRKVRIWLNGKRLISSTIPGRKSLDGPLGLFHQRCRCEIRMLRLGSID